MISSDLHLVHTPKEREGAQLTNDDLTPSIEFTTATAGLNDTKRLTDSFQFGSIAQLRHIVLQSTASVVTTARSEKDAIGSS